MDGKSFTDFIVSVGIAYMHKPVLVQRLHSTCIVMSITILSISLHCI